MSNIHTGGKPPANDAMTADPLELQKFSALAHRWWDPNSEFKPLHDINPLRLDHIDEAVGGLAGKKVLDVGCGGGILAESMAERGADVTGIDHAFRQNAAATTHVEHFFSRQSANGLVNMG